MEKLISPLQQATIDILDSISTGIIITDETGRFVQANKRCYDLFKVQELSALEQFFYGADTMFDLNDNTIQFKEEAINVINGKQPLKEFQFYSIGEDEQKKYYSIDLNPLNDKKEGAVINLIKSNAEKVYEREQKFTNLFQKSIDAIFITDKHEHFGEMNQSFLDLLDYSKEEALQLNIEQLFDQPDSYATFHKNLLRDGLVRGYDVLLRKKNGDRLNCLITCSKIKNIEGITTGYQGIIHNISEKIKAEKKLGIAEKLGMTGRIARSIAHEVRNPLTNLNLAMEELQESVAGDESGEMYVDIIKRNIERINQLITELLNSSKASILDLKYTSLNDVIEESIALARDRMKLKGIKITTDLDATLPTVRIDPNRLKIAFLNIIMNAIEAMEENNGMLYVQSQFVSDNLFEVTIKDTGKGIDQENLKRLFDPFFTAKHGGMGLGLTTSQNIISSHKGTIEVESEPDKGTTFHITFEIPQHQ